MDEGLSVQSRAEITSRYAKAYKQATKKVRDRVVDEVVAVTGWSRNNARRRLVAAAKQPQGSGRTVAKRPRKQRADKASSGRTSFSYDARLVLAKVWAASGERCRKYLATSTSIQLEPGCRVEVRAVSEDPAAPSAGALIASAEPLGDGRWHMTHCDGRHVVVATTVEVLERMIGVACDASLGERWRRLAGQLPAGSERAETLLSAQELAASGGADESGCCRGRALAEPVDGCASSPPLSEHMS